MDRLRHADHSAGDRQAGVAAAFALLRARLVVAQVVLARVQLAEAGEVDRRWIRVSSVVAVWWMPVRGSARVQAEVRLVSRASRRPLQDRPLEANCMQREWSHPQCYTAEGARSLGEDKIWTRGIDKGGR